MNIYTGLLFQHGHIGNADLARSLVTAQPSKDASPAQPSAPVKATKSVWASALARCRKAGKNRRLAAATRQSTALSSFR